MNNPATESKHTPGKYPLEIQNVGDDTYIVMSKGHHEPATFMAAVREYGYDWPLGMPEHKWVKTVPCGRACGMHTCHYELRDTPRKGWWPATYAYEAYGDDRYEARAAIQQATGQKGAEHE